MKKKTNYYFGFYRDYSQQDHPIVCQAVDNIDCLFCEILGGAYPLLEVSLSRKELKQYAFDLAFRYHASFVEINGGKLQRVG